MQAESTEKNKKNLYELREAYPKGAVYFVVNFLNMQTFFQNAKRWLPGAIISVALIAVILNAVDIPSTIEAIRSANYTLLLIAAALNIFWLMVRA